jgi:hypothetical protein
MASLPDRSNRRQRASQVVRTREYIVHTIMKNKMPKLAAAAVIAVVVIGGITFWPGSKPDSGKWWLGSPAAWGQEILAELDSSKAVTWREQTVPVMPDGSEITPITWHILYFSSDSYRRDIYDGDVLREIQWYVPDGDGTLFHSIRFDLKSYFTYSGEGRISDRDPVDRMRFYVGLLGEADRLLGEQVIDGVNCVGFEISTSKYGNNPGQWTDRIWFDVETKLPVRIEKYGRTPSDESEKTYVIIQDGFDYSPDLPADTFIPKTPEGFIKGHPDEIRAAQKKERKE